MSNAPPLAENQARIRIHARLRGWSTLLASGSEAASFLHNMCTNDVKGLENETSTEAFFTDVKGHILAHGLICKCDDCFEITLSSESAAELMEHLDRYLIREDVRLSLPESASSYFFAAGDGVVAVLNSAIAEPVTVTQVGGFAEEAAIVRAPHIMAKEVAASLEASASQKLSFKEWDAFRIQHRFPLDRIDITSRTLPQEVDRDTLAISFNKGCYLGQETVARIDALGHVNRRLRTLQFPADASPEPGEEVQAGEKAVGAVTSSCGPWALAYVRREHSAEGSVLASRIGDATVWSWPS